MHNNLIFLDIDGVLNSTTSFIGYKEMNLRPQLKQMYRDFHDVDETIENKEDFRFAIDLSMIDPVPLGLLRILVNKTNAHIIISSVWRMHKGGIKYFNKLFNHFGWDNAPIIGATPSSNHGRRGLEIEQWMKKNNFNPMIDRYVIIDDDSDMLVEQFPHFVKCDNRVGFTYDNYKKALDILNVDIPYQLPLFDNYIKPMDSYKFSRWGTI
jgi:hypothetical protein